MKPYLLIMLLPFLAVAIGLVGALAIAGAIYLRVGFELLRCLFWGRK